MAEPTLASVLMGYGYKPDLGSDSEGDVTTGDMLAKAHRLYSGPGGALRSLRDQIPESPNTLSILNMGRSGLNTMANWLQNSPEIGPDTLAPLGMAGVGGMLTAKGMPHAPRNMPSPKEWEPEFVGPHRGSDPWSRNPGEASLPETAYDRALATSRERLARRANGPLSGTSELPLAATVRAALDDPNAYYGIRVTEEPLRVGDRAPESRQWYQDYDTDKRHYTPEELAERYPDHGDSLGGTSTVGLTPDVAAARALARQYYGDHVSVVRGRDRQIGNDPGEWVIPNAEVIATAHRPHREFDLFSDQSKSSLPGTIVNSIEQEQKRSLADILLGR